MLAHSFVEVKLIHFQLESLLSATVYNIKAWTVVLFGRILRYNLAVKLLVSNWVFFFAAEPCDWRWVLPWRDSTGKCSDPCIEDIGQNTTEQICWIKESKAVSSKFWHFLDKNVAKSSLLLPKITTLGSFSRGKDQNGGILLTKSQQWFWQLLEQLTFVHVLDPIHCQHYVVSWFQSWLLWGKARPLAESSLNLKCQVRLLDAVACLPGSTATSEKWILRSFGAVSLALPNVVCWRGRCRRMRTFESFLLLQFFERRVCRCCYNGIPYFDFSSRLDVTFVVRGRTIMVSRSVSAPTRRTLYGR